MRWSIALCLASLAAIGCGGEKSGAGSGVAETIGVAPCDEYIAKMNACLGKMTASEKTAMESGYKDTRAAWKLAAEKGGAEKDQLKPACEAALTSMPPTCK
ncbi:MAG: hypothetical protein IPK82_10905 [Polyangiaceae bacterium]|nr:hypothetical protein [Polyangiaceae bacterium]